jgi:hypothetical protein
MPSIINDGPRYAAAAAGRVLSLAIRIEALADEVEALRSEIRAAWDEPVRRAGFRCETGIGWLRQASAELQEAADRLDRLAAAMKPGACVVRWGVCPEHGNTLTGSGLKTWCREPECGRTWNYDRVGLPCIEPARWAVTDRYDARSVMCDGHALDARKRLEGARVVLREEFTWPTA